MILHDADNDYSLFPYGIQIPICESKILLTLKTLQEDEALAGKIDLWYIKQSNFQLLKEDLIRAHNKSYIDRLFSEHADYEIIKTYELIDDNGKYNRYDPFRAQQPLSKLVDRAIRIASGTTEAMKIALSTGFCYYLGGGMHHAHHNYGSGFCLLNDIVIAIRHCRALNLINTAWVIDVDAHKGDGTAELTQSDDKITTLSVHMANGWPLNTGSFTDDSHLNPAFIPSDIDIPIKAGEESDYNDLLIKGLSKLDGFELPDIAVVVSGVDVYRDDELTSTSQINLDEKQIFNRDRIIYNFLKERNIKSVYLMAGGYGEKVHTVYTSFLRAVLYDRLCNMPF